MNYQQCALLKNYFGTDIGDTLILRIDMLERFFPEELSKYENGINKIAHDLESVEKLKEDNKNLREKNRKLKEENAKLKLSPFPNEDYFKLAIEQFGKLDDDFWNNYLEHIKLNFN